MGKYVDTTDATRDSGVPIEFSEQVNPTETGPKFEPGELSVTALRGETEGFVIVASTLRRTADGLDFYALLENRANAACDVNLQVEFFDANDQSLASAVGAVQGGHLYLSDDGSQLILNCISEGEQAVAAVTEIPDDVSFDAIKNAVYRLAQWDKGTLPFGVVPIKPFSFDAVEAFDNAEGTFLRGSLRNELDVSIGDPKLSLFFFDAAGRPLTVLTSSSSLQLEPGESWVFETDVVDDAGSFVIAQPVATVHFNSE
jgi:hypothetical protein